MLRHLFMCQKGWPDHLDRSYVHVRYICRNIVRCALLGDPERQAPNIGSGRTKTTNARGQIIF